MSRPEFPTIRTLKTYGLILFAGLLALPAAQSFAEEAVKTAKNKPALSTPAPPAGHVNVVELFSSRICAFCPQAEDYFHTLIERPGLIGLACHVSYFEADASPLAQKFCAERQSRYNAALHLGPNYTPQMLINGTQNAIGYKTDQVEETLAGSAASAPTLLDVKKIRNDSYQFNLPALGHDFQGNILIALIDKPHRLQGLNPKDPPSVFLNVVSAITDAGPWDGTARTLDIQVDLRAENKGFIVLAQDSATQKIVAAGQYLEP
ncbi:MAG: DUF1223 domain-containing protein [Alphaproteobacteria bacterium]|nr:DUF1223 domain-containing protein [Alphaproteobacteria bacterium]